MAHGGPGPNRGSGGQRPGGPNRESGERRPGGPGGDGSLDQISSKICANETLPPIFLAQMQQLFTTLQANGSFSQALTDRAQEVAYIQNANNAAVLSSNCTGYFSNLKIALNADRAVVEAREQYQRIVAKAIMDIIGNLIGRRRY